MYSMALQKTYTTRGEVGISDAYHRVGGITFEPDARYANFPVNIYKDEETRQQSLKKHTEVVEYVVTGDMFDTYFSTDVLNEVDRNPKERAYEYLKNEVEYYEDAITV